ncbi:hypothetical protein ABT001_08420 [Streptomyces sp. NPDC002793]|uniref:hypothetical protein n=1 Tax=Streptomyces sp. NPDC002793 TaxID=3154432 RepID=UPI003328E7BF
MNDPLPGRTAASPSRGLLRPVLWALLLLCAVCNAVTSTMDGVTVVVSVAFGLATLACGVGLVLHHRRTASAEKTARAAL